VITLLFALMYKILPDVEIQWRDVIIGAAVTSLLFVIGKTALGLYLGNSGVLSTYGAAGSLIIILLWIFYSALRRSTRRSTVRASSPTKTRSPSRRKPALRKAWSRSPTKRRIPLQAERNRPRQLCR
jgi:hypothetical protein